MLRIMYWSLPVLLAGALSAVAAGAETKNPAPHTKTPAVESNKNPAPNAKTPAAESNKNPGQEDLDKATQLKLSAQTAEDLHEVIRLSESAQQKGLDKESNDFAQEMIVAALVQRGLTGAKAILSARVTLAEWTHIRPQRDKILEELERAVKLDPKQAEALFFIARLNLLPDGDAKRASTALAQAVEASADDPVTQAKALGLRANLVTDPKKKRADLDRAIELSPHEASLLFARALLHVEQGDLAAAHADLRKVLELEPQSASAREALAMLLIRMKKYDEALVSLDKLRELEPSSPFAYVQQARIHVMQSKMPEALHDLNQAVARDANNVDVLLLRAEMLHEQGQKEKAQIDIDAALAIRPGNPAALRLRALFLAAEGQLDQAIFQMEDVRSRSKDPTTLATLAMLYAMGRHHRPAIDAYTALLKLQPDNFAALRNRGDVYLTVGKHAEAIADFNRAAAIDPHDAGLLNNLAWVLATSPVDKLRDGKRAVQLALEACKQTEYKKAFILSTLAAAYAETGDLKKAVEWSEKAVALGSDDQQEALVKELANYRAGKPTRELLTGDEPPPKNADKKPSAKSGKETAAPAAKP